MSLQTVNDLADRLRALGWHLATAESCTGGMIAAACTDLAGSSDWFDRGFITYSNAAKSEMLGVDSALIASDGAVSESVARAMAAGAQREAGVEVAVAVTGIAGPGGGTPGKPSGTVHFHLAARGGIHRPVRMVFGADRSGNKLLTAEAAIRMMMDYVNESAMSCML